MLDMITALYLHKELLSINKKTEIYIFSKRKTY